MKFILSSGKEFPTIGFGPGILNIPYKRCSRFNIPVRLYNKFIVKPRARKKFVSAITSAFIKHGYELLDYSVAYGNLDLVAKTLKLIRAKHPEKFPLITMRISNRDQFNGNIRETIIATKNKLGIDCIDLIQFHWPVTDRFIDTWKEMIKLKEEGHVRILGVANCHPHHIEQLRQATGILPEINQVEVHPLFTQKPLLDYCKSNGIIIEAYTPIARYDDRLIRLPLLKNLEKKYNKSLVQIILRWHIQNGVIPVVKAMSEKHQKSNIEIFDFELSDDEMKSIDSININSRLRYDPDNCDFTIL